MISMENKKPLSPHIQIYSWHISSLVSISHRITGIINIIAITVICFWSCWLILGENNYDFLNYFLGSLIGKFIILGVKMSETQYLAASTIEEAVNAHSKANGSARFLAGGTDLLVQIKSGIRKPNLVIDVKKIVELNSIEEISENEFVVGASVSGAN